MDTLRKPLAVVLALIAAVVLLHFVFTPFYPDSVDTHDIWLIINWPMAFAVIVALIATYIAKRNAETHGCDTKMYLCVNVMFYSAAALAILFFWNWFDDMNAGEDGQGQTHRFFWVVIDVLYVILMASLSVQIWKSAPRE